MQKYFLFFTSFLMLILLLKEEGILSSYIYIDNLNKNLMLLMTLMNMILMNFLIDKLMNNKYYLMLIMFMFIFFMLFFSSNMFFFYIMYEMTVLPLIFFVSSWGYSLERIKATMFMLIYTMMFSFPFLMVIVFFCNFLNLSLNLMIFNSFPLNSFLTTFCLMMFLVKIPIWGFHFWLPKTHVEASTEGSMMLASIVLKISGVGLIKFSYFFTEKMNFILNFFLSMSMLGAILISFLCFRQTDSKMLVAMSSITHMSLILILYFYSNTFSMMTLYLIMISHGLISPLMFMFLNQIYLSSNSRSLLLNRGILKNFNYLSMVWILLCSCNMGIPLSMNFFSEIMCIISIFKFLKLLIFIMIFIILFSGMYNINLFNFFNISNFNNSMNINFNFFNVMSIYSILNLVLMYFVIFEEL